MNKNLLRRLPAIVTLAAVAVLAGCATPVNSPVSDPSSGVQRVDPVWSAIPARP